jgi:hypothetical protein
MDKGGNQLTTQTPEMDMLYDFSEEAVPAQPSQAEKAAPVQTADIVALDLMRSSQYTLVIQLLPHDNDPAGRLCTIGVQLDKQAPSIIAIRGDELGTLPAPIWQLMEAQAQIAATLPAKKKATMPEPKTVSKQSLTPAVKPAPAPAPAPVAPAQKAPVAQKAPAPPQQPLDDIYSLFDL